MQVKIRTTDFHLFIPLPLALVGLAIRLTPKRAFLKIQAKVPAPLCGLLTKRNVKKLWRECRRCLKGYKGLELLRVESCDGTLVSVKL